MTLFYGIQFLNCNLIALNSSSLHRDCVFCVLDVTSYKIAFPCNLGTEYVGLMERRNSRLKFFFLISRSGEQVSSWCSRNVRSLNGRRMTTLEHRARNVFSKYLGCFFMDAFF
jgi:hypothetical protein